MIFSMLDASVVALGAATIGWIVWYFFLADRRAAVADMVQGLQRATITVHGGYAPAQVRVKAGAPIRLVFDRQETASCSEEVVFGDFGVRRYLPAFQRTAIDLPAQDAGRYEFTCGMSMLRGSLIVE